MQVHDSESTRR